MLIAFSVIGIMVLLLIYFVVHSQTLQRDLNLTRNSARQNAKKASRGLTSLLFVANELQKTFMTRLDTAHSKGLMPEKSYPVARSIVRSMPQVIMDFCEKGHSVEEALTRALQMSEANMEEVREFIKKQPREVRLAWSKNTPDGYVTACNAFTQKLLMSEKTEDNQ
ncbi:hypothetical protein DXV75_16375 [Alteromonas aestuariivivens]|uniref:DUF2489 domain-containing protein n=1 Tax=Alteromonas aestuariivivens TaxID=1938339 RepID=A0A3D8M2W0_9ALTE|nr:hypothetical protein [Alteromonas aestuariivivens]RDV23940.1 hypothetical protein DXV75_16375 [Alteromonas aestuariivivens]